MKGKRRKVVISALLLIGLALATALGTEASETIRFAAPGEDDRVSRPVMLPLVTVDWCPEVDGTTYYVGESGNDSNPGTKSRPFKTIQKGVDIAQAGDTVYVRSGIYYDPIKIKNSGNICAPIVVTGYPGERPVIDGQYAEPAAPDAVCDPVSGRCFNYRGLVTIEGSYILFEGFEVMRSRGRGILVDSGDHNTVRDCWIHECRNAGVRVIDSDYAVIESNKIWETTNYCTYDRPPDSGLPWPGALTLDAADHSIARGNEVFHNWSQGIHVMQMNGILIEDNVIYDNLRTQLQVDTCGYSTVQRNFVYNTNSPPFSEGDPPLGLVITTDYKFEGYLTDQTIVNNIIVGNRLNFDFWWAPPARGALINAVIANNTFANAVAVDPTRAINFKIKDHPEHRNVTIENNIFLQTTPGIIARVPENPVFSWSHNLWSTPPSPSSSGPGDLVADPKLLNPNAPPVAGKLNADWFKLQSSSPAIDAAKIVVKVVDDFFGTVRGSSPDMGAHEHK